MVLDVLSDGKVLNTILSQVTDSQTISVPQQAVCPHSRPYTASVEIGPAFVTWNRQARKGAGLEAELLLP